MPTVTPQRSALRIAATTATSLAIGLAAASASSAGAAAPSATAAGSAATATTSVDAAIPYLSVLQPLAIHRSGHVVLGKIKLRAIIAADGLKTAWSIRVIHATATKTTRRVVAHGTLSPTQTKTVAVVVSAIPHSILRYDVTAHNADGGTPSPPQHTRIA